MISKYRVIETLSKICVENHWFNSGSIAQYGTMFDLATDLVNNAQDETTAEMQIADVIWICTTDRNGEPVNYKCMFSEIIEWFEAIRKENKPDEDDDSGIGQAFNPD